MVQDLQPDAGSQAQSEFASFVRVKELYLKPLPGNFDADHLKAVHRHIFQDYPDLNQPGQYREASDSHLKGRRLEGDPVAYPVRYAPMRDPQDADQRINQVLADVHPDKLRGLPVEAFAQRMAEAYAKLDHIHPFTEGNSRTLRVFTSQIAREAGLDLDWTTTNVSDKSRNALYVARDSQVLALTSYDTLTSEHAMRMHARATHHVNDLLGQDGPSLESIIAQSTRPLAKDQARAEAFASLPDQQALSRFPDLAPAYGAMAYVHKQLDAEGVSGQARARVEQVARAYISDRLSQGQSPSMPAPGRARPEPDKGPER